MTGRGEKTIVTIDGIDGSGKSTFARRFVDGLAGQAVLVSVDLFRRPVDWAAAGPDEAERYYDGYFDLAACDACLHAFLAGAPALTVPSFDSIAEQIVGTRTLSFQAATVAVVEGVFPLRLEATAAGLVIYLEVGAAEARRRVIERDLEKGRTRDEIERRIDRRYAPGQGRYHARYAPRDRADVVIDNEHPAAPRALVRDLARVPPAVRPLIDRVLPPLG